MRKHIRIIALLIAVLLVFGLAACGGGNSSESADGSASEPEAGTESEATSGSASDESAKAESQSAKDVLVVYFSATGTTKGVAGKIADITGADIYEIKAAQEYTPEDLDWHDSDSRTTHEQNDPDVRPEIGSDPVSLEGYSTIYSGGSGIGMSGKNLESNAGSGSWLEGERLDGGVSEEELRTWIDGLQ